MAHRNAELDWAQAAAPSLEEFAALAGRAFAALPETFRRLCGEVQVRVEEFPDDESLDELGCESAYDLLGLFRGVGLAQATPSDPSRYPNMVFLYRRPIIDYWAEHEETLGSIVTHVLVHEIGHHFGLSDDDMTDLEAAADSETLALPQGTVQ